MQIFASFQGIIILALSVAALASEVFAFVDALRHRPDAYSAAGKKTKNFWLLILGVALAVGIATFGNIIGGGFLGIIAFVAAAVYLADVRPALRQVSGSGGGRRNNGPYGPW